MTGQTSTSGRPAGTILNLGCGRQHVDRAVNVDCKAGVAPVNKLIGRLANRFPVRYERRWTWLFLAWFLYFELEVVKEGR